MNAQWARRFLPAWALAALLCWLPASAGVPAHPDSATHLDLPLMSAHQQDSPANSDGNCDSTRINTARFAIVGGTLLGGMTAIHLYQMNGWWKDNRRSFHIREDLTYGMSVDKLGHFYGGAVLTFIFSKSLRWANFSESSARWWGAGGSLLFQTYVEVEDGFSEWGFDRVDWATDVAGAFYPVVQYYVPVLQNFNLKFSYHPSDLLDSGAGIGFRGQKHIMFDDYEGQTIWLSANVHNLLPERLQPYWPAWLCLAVGYGARDVGTAHPYRVYFLALDLDVTKILPRNSGFFQTLGEALNYIHLPMPAVRVEPGAIWYGLYF
jgi:hypothetical protein